MFVSMRVLGPRRAAKATVIVAMGLALAATTARPTYAREPVQDDGGGIAAGFIGGAAAGLVAFGAGDPYGPPPPPPYGVEPIEEGPPPPCHDILVESYDPYAQAYVEVPQRVCDGY